MQRAKYTSEFKEEAVRPGVSIAALALQHGMNVNILHRWFKEYELGRHRPEDAYTGAIVQPSQPTAFVPIPLPSLKDSAAPMPTQSATATADIRNESHRNGLRVTVSWPVSACGDCAQMLREVLR